ncbi:DEAD/DEAH box helicase [Aestuariibacter sp. A3R04]|uniref:DEAD/DEAH box helicase n=1 Tax=Aestuariibacter sp. A3R04 TaxID=2841571 RepID=UPI001C085C39|nr:DEAD/DEAH box helicase [Aestuariibacter sp. A3R04]MBU3022939.1 DEAD/DEAH box helicase [Aestuariibacter sp. A3R04]
MLIVDLPVHHKIIKRLSEKGLETLTEIQEKTILPAMQGKDIMASSKTGSGKTFAFLIPLVHRLMTTKALSRQDPRALILAPTRELAKQVYSELRSLGTGLGIQCALIVGGENYNDQTKALRKNPHVIVGTAGRIADHLEDKSFFINGLELLIFDEADRMMDLGFADQLNLINRFADHRKRQTMLFSATLDNIALQHLTKSLLKAPVRVAVGDATEAHQDISQTLYYADDVGHKDRMVSGLLASFDYNQAVVFTATREDTDRIATLLNEAKLDAIALRGDLPQNTRAAIMNNFSRGQHSVLVTTDLASRGLDLRKVGLVINFDLPKQADEYIHRIGRTGRAGDKGVALSFVGPRDWTSYLNIKAHVNYPLECESNEKFPAKFKGKQRPIAEQQSGAEKQRQHRKHTTSSPATKKKRVNTMQGQEAGNMPIVKRKRNLSLDDEEE